MTNEGPLRRVPPARTHRVWLGAALAVGLAHCASPPSTASANNPGALALEPARLDLGVFDLHERQIRATHLTNPTGLPISVLHVSSSRFCSGVVSPTRLEPHTYAELRITCESDVAGPLREQLSVRTSSDSSPHLTLDVLGQVMPRLAFEVPVASAHVPYGESRRVEVRVVGRLADAATLVVRHDRNARRDNAPDAEITTAPKGIVLRFPGNKVGSAVGQLQVATGLVDPSTLVLSWSTVVHGSLQVTPTNPYFDLKRSGPKQVLLDVSSTQPGFRVSAVRVTHGPFSASLEPSSVGSSTRRIRVRVQEARCPLDVAGVQGTLLIVSNDHSEPEKQVALLGLGRLAH